MPTGIAAGRSLCLGDLSLQHQASGDRNTVDGDTAGITTVVWQCPSLANG